LAKLKRKRSSSKTSSETQVVSEQLVDEIAALPKDIEEDSLTSKDLNPPPLAPFREVFMNLFTDLFHSQLESIREDKGFSLSSFDELVDSIECGTSSYTNTERDLVMTQTKKQSQ